MPIHQKLTLTLLAAMALATAHAAAATFYVDSAAGDDHQAGTSPDAAWKTLAPVNEHVFGPGDAILFRAGGQWTGHLRPQGSGAPNRPIRMGRYGEGALPRIDAGEAGGVVVQLENQDQWEISGLQLSAGAAKPDEPAGGIHVRATTAGRVLQHIVIRDCVIHDIIGTVKKYDSCAIWVGVPGWNNKAGLTTGFDDVQITGNRIDRADRCGILIWTPSTPGTDAPARRHFTAGLIASKNVVIRGNVLSDIGGDAILVLGADRPLIDRNIVHRSCTKSGAEALGKKGYNPHAAAVWLHHCYRGVMQFNEVYDSVKLPLNNDGMAYDFDFNCFECIAQYNLSVNNAGGFLLIMPTARNNIARYNLSVNDAHHVLYLTCDLDEQNQIYNNTFYTERRGAFLVPHAQIRNNLFIAAGDATFDVKRPEKGVFSNNCYAGRWLNLPPDQQQVTADPQLVDPRMGPGGAVDLSGFALKATSPCRGRGVVIDNHGGRDLAGADVPLHHPPDLGALQFAPAAN